MPITFDQIALVDNGARFYTADLHVHAFGGSDDVSDHAMTVEAVIDGAFRNGVSILGLTDHNSDNNLLRATEYASKYAGQMLVLPGVEITTANGHLLIYFAPEKADSVRDLLAVIKIIGQRGARDNHTTLSMADVVSEAERLGGICIAAHIDRLQTGFEALAKGYPNWKKDIISSSGLYGLEFDDASHLVWYSPDDEPTPDGSERNKLLQARSHVPGIAARQRLAAVQNSDAHTLADLNAQHTKRFLTRFKMSDLTFDGLRTALIDPDARVRAVATIPSAVPRVLGMQVSGGFLGTATLHLSDNLNCFIGGRGTGKSTAIQSLGYALGIQEDFGEQDNCPDDIVIYCEDPDGIRYRYERIRGHDPTVQAKEDQSIRDVPSDAFRVEFYGQGELAEVAKDPLRNPRLLQDFLDRHIVLADLVGQETELLQELDQNSAQLIPLEASAGQLPSKQATLGDINKKLELAEAGRLKDIVTLQSRLAAEKTLCQSLGDIHRLYHNGLTMASVQRDFAALIAAVGPLTGYQPCEPFLQKAKAAIHSANLFLESEQKVINERLREVATSLQEAIAGLQAQHRALEQQINAKITEFQKKGLSGDLKGLNELIRQRTTLTTEIARIKAQAPQLEQLRRTRRDLLKQLAENRTNQMRRRKDQLALINKNLRQTIEDYAINLLYDPAGIIENFSELVVRVMHGTYFQEDTARTLCSQVAPQGLAEWVVNSDLSALSKIIGEAWAKQVVGRFQILTNQHALEVVAKPAKPVIKVLTRGTSPRQIPVTQLSDGQKHTILLTIAMLAESNLPLIMDQPEDDLDNAFIFKSVVSTLRLIKERRQVILVTHNANIAVLGDSEVIFPMRRNGDKGEVFDRGSIDRPQTSLAVQNILEGGELAFRRRKEIYGY